MTFFALFNVILKCFFLSSVAKRFIWCSIHLHSRELIKMSCCVWRHYLPWCPVFSMGRHYVTCFHVYSWGGFPIDCPDISRIIFRIRHLAIKTPKNHANKDMKTWLRSPSGPSKFFASQLFAYMLCYHLHENKLHILIFAISCIIFFLHLKFI